MFPFFVGVQVAVFGGDYTWEVYDHVAKFNMLKYAA